MIAEVAGIPLRSPVFLAPMAGITDLPFRRLVSRFGAGLTISEMVASGEILTARPGTRERAALDLEIGAGAVQLAGRDAEPMAEAAKLVADLGATLIDINMGCPAKKVTGGASGAALMREPDRALRLIEAVRQAAQLPVSVKMRLGWDDTSLNAATLAVSAESAGVSMITVHGRTRAQFYKGEANWSAIGSVVEAVTIPVVANGDVRSLATARNALKQSGAAAVMIGRGSQGAPWRLAQIAAGLAGEDEPEAPDGSKLTELVCGHFDETLRFYGSDLGHRCFKKHLGWYLDAAHADQSWRKPLLTAPDPGRVFKMIPGAFGAARKAAA